MNTEKLTAFINTLNGKEGTGSHLVTVPPGPSLADALLSSPILAGEGGTMMGLGASDFEFGVDPSADPELALVSIPLLSSVYSIYIAVRDGSDGLFSGLLFRPCVYQWRSNDRDRRKRPAELLLPLPPRQACPPPLQTVKRGVGNC